MCGLYAFDQRKDQSTGETDYHGGRPLPSNSNVINPISVCGTIHFIDAWITH